MSVAIGTAQPSNVPPPTVTVAAYSGGGDSHAADRGDDRQGGRGGRTQFADDQFSFEFDAGDQEEDGEQSVCGPVADREVEAECGNAESDVSYLLVDTAPRGVRPDERHDCRGEQHQAADGLGAQCVGHGIALGQRQQAEERGAPARSV